MAAPKKTQKRMPRRREEFTYRGYKIDELKAMGISELLPLMPAPSAPQDYPRFLPR